MSREILILDDAQTNFQSTKCPVCSDSLERGENISCPRCATPHHLACWKYNENLCAIYGCQASPPSPQQTQMQIPNSIYLIAFLPLLILIFKDSVRFLRDTLLLLLGLGLSVSFLFALIDIFSSFF